MKTRIIFALAMVCTSHIATAETCNLRAHALDLRDGGLTLDPQVDSSLWLSRGDVRDCELTVRATALANPRSSAIREFDGSNYRWFDQEIIISDISLAGQGSLKFMSYDFFASLYNYRLDLYITPNPIPAGATQANSFDLSGEWISFSQQGEVLGQRQAFYTLGLTTTDKLALTWSRRPQYPEQVKLGLVFNGNVEIPIHTYSQADDNNFSPWRFPFSLVSKNVGSLSQTSLTPQSSFKIGGSLSCGKFLSDPNQGVCD